MSLRYFTVQEANELLPELEPLVGRVLTLRARASHHSREMGALLADLSKMCIRDRPTTTPWPPT